jgi:hypothetical protein
MAFTRFHRWNLAVLLLAALAVPAAACPFCGMQGQTLVGEVNEASLVVFGTLTNPKLDPGNDAGQGTTDLRIEKVLKSHEIVEGKKVITLPRYLPTDEKATKFLIFCGVFKGKIDPYRGISVKSDSDIVKYLEGAVAVKDKPIGARLRFYFDFLDNADVEVANDAYKEFGNADYKDYREMAGKLPAGKIAKWLLDPETPAFRFGLYASMLGHCGGPKEAAVLRSMLDDQAKRLNTGVDGVLAGYTMLEPKAGWAYLCDILKDPGKEFMLRYAALRAARFFWESRPDVIHQKAVVQGIAPLLDQNDIADLAIEDLRKWRCWDLTDRVLALYGQKTHDIPIIRRAILRFALCSPGPKAAPFVEALRKKDPDFVKDAEELLKLESDTGAKPEAK